jgi:hypothetical protein
LRMSLPNQRILETAGWAVRSSMNLRRSEATASTIHPPFCDTIRCVAFATLSGVRQSA